MNSTLNLPALEEEILAFWKDRHVIERFGRRNEDGPRWVTYEGPPTVNGNPALHHVWTSTYKDVYARFQTLRGKRIDRKGGWDCQGLPVEIAVERKLGLSDKREIEAYGIEKFVRECREMVVGNIATFERVLERYGYWVDYEDAYRTMADTFLESVWWHMKHMWSDGMLYEGEKVVPYCVRCATVLSSHELGQPNVYRDVSHEAAYVAMPLVDSDDALVVWTTTPWTLPANVAIAVNPDLEYGRYRMGDRTLIVAVSRAEEALPDAESVETVSGASLVGREYVRPFADQQVPTGRHSVVIPSTAVEEGVGTGVLHVAPAFGEEDAELGEREGLAVLNTIDASGKFKAGQFAGSSVHTTSPAVLADLRDRGLLVRSEAFAHQYPHCWRCSTPLIYWAKPTWFIATSTRRQELIAENEKITWYPDNLKHGRFGNWLVGNVDWAVSRDRFWGTPLPIWRCVGGHHTCVGSRVELTELTGVDQSVASLHRPEIDAVTFACPECGETATRDTAVCDVWLDSGCVPAAQWGYPRTHEEEFTANFPADFVCEAIDQTRGWFYSMLATGVMVFGETPFKNVVCLGLLVDDEGKKMSKSIGNVIDPQVLLPSYGADGVRWYLLTSGAPWGTRRISFQAIEQRIRRDLSTLWNVVGFYTSYADIEEFSSRGEVSADHLDRWITSRLNTLVASVTADMEGYGSHRAVQDISAFIDELSNWYVRRSRRRFWSGDQAAFETLHHTLSTLSLILSPFCPFVAEAVHRSVNGADAESVHLLDWPTATPDAIDEVLESQMGAARQISSLLRAARSDAGLAIRQPVAEAVVTGIDDLPDAVRKIIEDEANVHRLRFGAEVDLPLEYQVRPNWRMLGPRHRDDVDRVATALTNLDDAGVIDQLRSQAAVKIRVDDLDVIIQPDEVEIVEVRVGGWQFATDGGLSVAVDTQLTPALVVEGERRTLVRHIQVARRESGLAIQDRISLWLAPEVLAHANLIVEEVLATSVGPIENAPTDVLVSGRGFAFERAS